MKKEKNKNGVITLLVVVIVILLALVILFATGTISFKNNDDIDIDLSIDSVKVTKDAPNAKIFIDGTISLSYDNNKYAGVTLSGYCLGSDNEKNLIHGPGDGGSLFNNDGNNILLLTENIPQNVEYDDGTVKVWSEIDWSSAVLNIVKSIKRWQF